MCSRMMATILTDECGTHLVWVGRLEDTKPNSKKSFKKTLTNIYAALLGKVMRFKIVFLKKNSVYS